MRIVAQCSGISEATEVKNRLGASGIKAFVHDKHTRHLRRGIPPSVAVSVPAEDIGKATLIIREHFAYLCPVPDILPCSHCAPEGHAGFRPISTLGLLSISIVARLSGRPYCPFCRNFRSRTSR